MDKKPKGICANPATQIPFARPKNGGGSQDHVRQPALVAIFPDQFLLFEFPETVSVIPFLRCIFQWAALIEQRATFQGQVRIDCKRTNVHETLGPPKFQKSFDQIAGGQSRIHKRASERFFNPGGEMIND